MFLCNLFLMMCDSGSQISPKGIMFVVCMLCSLIRSYHRIGRLLTWFGINRFLLRCLFLPRGCFMIVFLLNQIWLIAMSLMQRRASVCQVAVLWRMPDICSCLAIVLGGLFCGIGLALIALTTVIFQVTLFSLFIPQVAWRREGHLCSLFGCLLFGSYGTKEIIDYLIRKKVSWLNC